MQYKVAKLWCLPDTNSMLMQGVAQPPSTCVLKPWHTHTHMHTFTNNNAVSSLLQVSWFKYLVCTQTLNAFEWCDFCIGCYLTVLLIKSKNALTFIVDYNIYTVVCGS